MTLDGIRGLNMKDALDQCSGLGASELKDLMDASNPVDHRVLFVLKVVSEWVIPPNLNAGIVPLRSNFGHDGSIGDYGEARSFIMKQRVKSSGDPRAQKAKDAAWTSWFYPEYKDISNVRDRLVQVAKDHAWLDHNHLMQANLFSLNGFFNWTNATQSAHTFSTCGLFIRACRAAARVLEQKDWPTNTPQGTDPCITGPSPNAAAIKYDERGDREPKTGDIFHVGPNETCGDHVGIIAKVHGTSIDGNWIWSTVEGGQGSGYLTRYFPQRTIVLDGNGKRYHGEGQYRRPLVKWIDLEQLVSTMASQ